MSEVIYTSGTGRRIPRRGVGFARARYVIQREPSHSSALHVLCVLLGRVVGTYGWIRDQLTQGAAHYTAAPVLSDLLLNLL
jgi:hypothetical protein